MFKSRNTFPSHLTLGSGLFCLESVVISLEGSLHSSVLLLLISPALRFLVLCRSSALSLSHSRVVRRFVLRREVVPISICENRVQVSSRLLQGFPGRARQNKKTVKVVCCIYFSHQSSIWCKCSCTVDSLQLSIKVQEQTILIRFMTLGTESFQRCIKTQKGKIKLQ